MFTKTTISRLAATTLVVFSFTSAHAEVKDVFYYAYHGWNNAQQARTLAEAASNHAVAASNKVTTVQQTLDNMARSNEGSIGYYAYNAWNNANIARSHAITASNNVKEVLEILDDITTTDAWLFPDELIQLKDRVQDTASMMKEAVSSDASAARTQLTTLLANLEQFAPTRADDSQPKLDQLRLKLIDLEQEAPDFLLAPLGATDILVRLNTRLQELDGAVFELELPLENCVALDEFLNTVDSSGKTVAQRLSQWTKVAGGVGRILPYIDQMMPDDFTLGAVVVGGGAASIPNPLKPLLSYLGYALDETSLLATNLLGRQNDCLNLDDRLDQYLTNNGY